MKLNQYSYKLARFVGTSAVILFCLTGIVLLQQTTGQLAELQLTKTEYLKQEQTQQAGLELLKTLPAFGFNNLVASWIYLRFIQYFGNGEAREQTGYSLSPEYFEAIVNRDPRFVGAHLRLSPATSIFAGKPRKDIALIEQSLQSVSPKIAPEAYYLWIYKGVDEMLFLGDTEAAKHSYEMAANWAEASDDPDVQARAANARQTAQFLAKNPDSKVAQIGAWTMVLSSATDAKTQQRAIDEIKALGGEIITPPEGRLSVKVPDDG